MYSPETGKGATPCLDDLAVPRRPRFLMQGGSLGAAGSLYGRTGAVCTCGTYNEGQGMVEYETISGFFERVNPEAFALIEEPEIDLIPDEEWLENKCKELGLQPRTALWKGELVKLFPTELLRERLG